MKKIFLVKKDPKLPTNEDNWIVMNMADYLRFVSTPEGKQREKNFGKLNGCDEDDVIIMIECGKEAAAALRAENDHRDYLREEETASRIKQTVSLYDHIPGTDGDCSGEEIIADTFCNVEEEALLNIEIEELRKVLKCLSHEEMMLLKELYLSNIRRTEVECCKVLNISRKKLRYLKQCALKKLHRKMKEIDRKNPNLCS